MLHLRPLILLGSLLASSFASAGWEDLSPKEFHVKAPPRAGSVAERKDFEELHRLERERSDEECAMASRQRYPSFEAVFVNESDVLTSEEAQRFSPLVTRVMDVTEKVTGHFKRKHARPRPFNTDPTLQPCAPKPSGSTSYPSSHASMSYAGACVLSAVMPERERPLMRLGRLAGDLRAVVGVHHPSDVRAAQDLAQQICDLLLEDAEFRAELDALHAIP